MSRTTLRNRTLRHPTPAAKTRRNQKRKTRRRTTRSPSLPPRKAPRKRATNTSSQPPKLAELRSACPGQRPGPTQKPARPYTNALLQLSFKVFLDHGEQVHPRVFR